MRAKSDVGKRKAFVWAPIHFSLSWDCSWFVVIMKYFVNINRIWAFYSFRGKRFWLWRIYDEIDFTFKWELEYVIVLSLSDGRVNHKRNSIRPKDFWENWVIPIGVSICTFQVQSCCCLRLQFSHPNFDLLLHLFSFVYIEEEIKIGSFYFITVNRKIYIWENGNERKSIIKCCRDCYCVVFEEMKMKVGKVRERERQ